MIVECIDSGFISRLELCKKRELRAASNTVEASQRKTTVYEHRKRLVSANKQSNSACINSIYVNSDGVWYIRPMEHTFSV